MDPTDPDDAWQMRFSNAVEAFGYVLYDLHHTNPWPEIPAIDQAVGTIATILWNKGFSQTDIMRAYKSAIADLSNYAAGEETRS